MEKRTIAIIQLVFGIAVLLGSVIFGIWSYNTVLNEARAISEQELTGMRSTEKYYNFSQEPRIYTERLTSMRSTIALAGLGGLNLISTLLSTSVLSGIISIFTILDAWWKIKIK